MRQPSDRSAGPPCTSPLSTRKRPLALLAAVMECTAPCYKAAQLPLLSKTSQRVCCRNLKGAFMRCCAGSNCAVACRAAPTLCPAARQTHKGGATSTRLRPATHVHRLRPAYTHDHAAARAAAAPAGTGVQPQSLCSAWCQPPTYAERLMHHPLLLVLLLAAGAVDLHAAPFAKQRLLCPPLCRDSYTAMVIVLEQVLPDHSRSLPGTHMHWTHCRQGCTAHPCTAACTSTQMLQPSRRRRVPSGACSRLQLRHPIQPYDEPAPSAAAASAVSQQQLLQQSLMPWLPLSPEQLPSSLLPRLPSNTLPWDTLQTHLQEGAQVPASQRLPPPPTLPHPWLRAQCMLQRSTQNATAPYQAESCPCLCRTTKGQVSLVSPPG